MLENEISILMQGKQHAESTCNICMYQIYMAFSIFNDILLYNYHLRGILSDIWTQRLWSKLLHDFNTQSILHSIISQILTRLFFVLETLGSSVPNILRYISKALL